MLSEEGYIKYPDAREIELGSYDSMGYHLRMENEEYLEYEDGTSGILEESVAKTSKYRVEFTNDVQLGHWHLLTEADEFVLSEDGSNRLLIEKPNIDPSIDAWEKEYEIYDSFGYHLKFEDDDHIINEADGTYLILNDLEFKTPDITKHYVTEEAPSDMQKWTPDNHELDYISAWKDIVVTRTYGMQPFRPHYVQNWSDANISYINDKFTQEDDTGLILLEHPVSNQDFLIFEDYPEVLQDVLNLNREVLDNVLLEEQTLGVIDGNAFDFLQLEENTIAGPGKGTARLLHESSRPKAEGYGAENTLHQAWAVLPAYQYFRKLTRLQGTVTIPNNSTSVTGSGSAFTTQLKVGEEFQTANENIISEDTGGGIMLETDERLEHEEMRIMHVQSLVIGATDLLGSQLKDFTWYFTTEDTTISAHGTHSGVIGEYGIWNTENESFWILGADTNAESGLGIEANTDGFPGGIEREAPEWENNNMLWEDGSKQLVTDPQAFMVGTITNDTSLTVTRKCMPGGVSDSVYQL